MAEAEPTENGKILALASHGGLFVGIPFFWLLPMITRDDEYALFHAKQAGAVAVLIAARRGLPVSWRTPTEVKAAVTGSGRADKAQVTAMIKRLLNIEQPLKPADAADALALAITDIWRFGGEQRYADALASHAAGSPR